MAYRSARNDRDSSQAALAKVDSDLAGAKQAIAKLTADMPSAQADLQAVETQHAEALKALTEIQQRFAAKNDLVNAVSLAAAKADLAQQKFARRYGSRTGRCGRQNASEQLAAEAAELQKQTARDNSRRIKRPSRRSGKQTLDAATADVAKYQQQVPALEMQHGALVEKLHAAMNSAYALPTISCSLRRGSSPRLRSSRLRPSNAWSVMCAVGLADQLHAASEAEVNQKTPLTDAIRNDPRR